MDYQHIRYESLDRVARISHARPHRRNAQNVELLDELDHGLQRAVADPEIRVIVIAGQGDHFSAGHDLKDAAMHRRQITPEDRYQFEDERYLGYCLRLWDAPKPVIAQVQGACIAAGFMVANMCDLVVASDDAFFADPVVNSFGAAAVEVLVSAQEAHAIGMVNKVGPRTELQMATLALAHKIAESSSFALRLMKRSLNRTADIQGFRAALDAHFDTHQLSHMSTEAQQRQAAGFDATIQAAKARVA